MNIPLNRNELLAQIPVWRRVVSIGYRDLATAKRGGGKSACLAALRAIRDAEAELAAIKRLLQITEKSAEARNNPSPWTAERIRRVLSPKPATPRPDPKRDQRERDREIRARMKGAKRSDDSKHGYRNKKAVA